MFGLQRRIGKKCFRRDNFESIVKPVSKIGAVKIEAA